MLIMRKYFKCLCLALCFLLAYDATAQTGVQLWGDYYQYRMTTNNRWKMSNRFALRYQSDELSHYNLAYRPDVARKIMQNGRLMVGNGAFYLLNDGERNSLELRPWVGFQRDPSHLNSLAIIHLWRWENRFFIGQENIFESRLRYKMTARVDVFRREGKALSLVVSSEFFVSLGHFDQVKYNRLRTELGARYQWNTNWQTDLSLTNQSDIEDSFFSGEDYEWIFQLKVKRLLFRN